jgi:hypothetical protein
MCPTPRTITDITTGATLRLFTDDTTHRFEYRDETTGDKIGLRYVNLMGSPIYLRLEDGKQLTLNSMQCVNSSVKVTHTKYYEEARFKKL